MTQDYLDYIKVIVMSGVKFIFGPVYGVVDQHLSLFETIVFTATGMMFSVILITYFGEFIRARFFSKQNETNKIKVNKKRRNIVKVWNKHGIKGVAFLTPLLFSPIGGTIIALSFGAKRRDIFLYMFMSAVLWAIVLSSTLFFFKDLLIQYGVLDPR